MGALRIANEGMAKPPERRAAEVKTADFADCTDFALRSLRLSIHRCTPIGERTQILDVVVRVQRRCAFSECGIVMLLSKAATSRRTPKNIHRCTPMSTEGERGCR